MGEQHLFHRALFLLPFLCSEKKEKKKKEFYQTILNQTNEVIGTTEPRRHIPRIRARKTMSSGWNSRASLNPSSAHDYTE